MSRACIAAVVIAGACYSPPSLECVACGPNGECPDDLPCATDGRCRFEETPCAGVEDACFGDGKPPFFVVCAPPALFERSRELPAVIDTDEQAACDLMPATPVPLCTIAGNTIAVLGKTRVVGSRPLVVAGRRVTIVMAAEIDLSGHAVDAAQGTESPAAADGTCAPLKALTNKSIGGGGAGGAFRALGGAGGAGDNGVVDGAMSMATPMTFKGGCHGGEGGIGTGDGGKGGHGGGAIYIAAHHSLDIDGVINASGGGAPAAGLGGGGGGGGGGGTIMLWSAGQISISASGSVFALGGGGGTGSLGGGSAVPGLAGNDAGTIDGAAGVPSATAGSGGAGGTTTVEMGEGGGPGGPAAGGGGGGGGVGHTLVRSPMVTGVARIAPVPR